MKIFKFYNQQEGTGNNITFSLSLIKDKFTPIFNTNKLKYIL